MRLKDPKHKHKHKHTHVHNTGTHLSTHSPDFARPRLLPFLSTLPASHGARRRRIIEASTRSFLPCGQAPSRLHQHHTALPASLRRRTMNPIGLQPCRPLKPALTDIPPNTTTTTHPGTPPLPPPLVLHHGRCQQKRRPRPGQGVFDSLQPCSDRAVGGCPGPHPQGPAGGRARLCGRLDGGRARDQAGCWYVTYMCVESREDREGEGVDVYCAGKQKSDRWAA